VPAAEPLLGDTQPSPSDITVADVLASPQLLSSSSALEQLLRDPQFAETVEQQLILDRNSKMDVIVRHKLG